MLRVLLSASFSAGVVATAADATCHAISPAATDDWCQNNCNYTPPNCPASLCSCDAPTPGPAPGPAPPTPRPSPSPSPGPAAHCSGDITDGWFLAPYAASSSGSAPASSCMAIYFWGMGPAQWVEFVKQQPTAYTADKLLPGTFPYKILNLGGGGTSWSDTAVENALSFLPTIQKLGYNGVCLDTEVFGSFTMSKFLNFFSTAKRLGLTTVLTTTAEGPYSGCDSPNDCWKDIKWDDIDFIVPQMYGASGANYPASQFDEFANFWKNGGGQGVHGKFPGPSNLKKILWAVHSGSGKGLYDKYSFAGGYIEWAYKALPATAEIVV